MFMSEHLERDVGELKGMMKGLISNNEDLREDIAEIKAGQADNHERLARMEGQWSVIATVWKTLKVTAVFVAGILAYNWSNLLKLLGKGV